jgi:hypothetical protein
MNQFEKFFYLISIFPHKSISKNCKFQEELAFFEKYDLTLIRLATGESALLWDSGGKNFLSLANPKIIFSINETKIFFSTPFIYNEILNNVGLPVENSELATIIFEKIENMKKDLQEKIPGIEVHFE